MTAKYLFRLDDANAYSNFKKWSAIESIFQKYDIKPIVAVVPDNKDPKLMFQKLDSNFWSRVKDWDDKGWEIAMHGYQHVFHRVNRLENIIPFYNRSEFSGLSLLEQKEKIEKSQEIFLLNGFAPKVWVAPAHAYDKNTLKAISSLTEIKIVSDGISLFPFFSQGFSFLPQQLWKIKKKYFGLWTVCLHPDSMTDKEIIELELQLSSPYIYKNVLSVQDIEMKMKDRNVLDFIYSLYFFTRFFLSKIYRYLAK